MSSKIITFHYQIIITIYVEVINNLYKNKEKYYPWIWVELFSKFKGWFGSLTNHIIRAMDDHHSIFEPSL
jgi:hypothetical protein